MHYSKDELGDIARSLVSINELGKYLKSVEAALDRSQAVIEFNMDGKIITANKNFLDVMGYTLEEVKGKHHSMFAPAGVASSDEYKEFWAKLNRGEFGSGEYKRVGKGGKEIYIKASYNPIEGADGKPVKVIKYASDVTVASEEQSSAINEINAAVSQMDSATQENAAMFEESTASAQTLSELAGNLNELVGFFKVDEDDAGAKPAQKK